MHGTHRVTCVAGCTRPCRHFRMGSAKARASPLRRALAFADGGSGRIRRALFARLPRPGSALRSAARPQAYSAAARPLPVPAACCLLSGQLSSPDLHWERHHQHSRNPVPLGAPEPPAAFVIGSVFGPLNPAAAVVCPRTLKHQTQRPPRPDALLPLVNPPATASYRTLARTNPRRTHELEGLYQGHHARKLSQPAPCD